MKLYSLAMSPYAARVRLSLRLKDLAIDIVEPPTDWRESAAWRSVSPLGRVPALRLDDGTTIVESMVILEYIEDAFPASRPLRPRTAEGAARARFVAAIAANEGQAALQQLLYAMSPATGLDTDRGPALLTELATALDRVESVLVAAPYGAGDTPSLADCCLLPLRFTLGKLGPMIGRDLLAGRPKLAGYEAAIGDEPAMRRTWDELDAALVDFLRGWREGA